MTGVDSWSGTAATNATADAAALNWAEGMAPSVVNNSARQMIADLRAAFNDLIWFQYGTGDQGAGNIAVPSVYASGTSFTIAGADVTAPYHAGRRVRAVGSSTGTIYGSISSSSYNGGNTTTTVNVTWDSGSLSNETLVVSLSQIPVTGTPLGKSGSLTLTGTLAVTGHTTLEGVTSTGATGSGKLVYDTAPTFATTLGVTGKTTLTGGVITSNFSQAAAVSGTFYTAIANADLTATGGQSVSNTFDVTVTTTGATPGVYRVTYNGLGGGAYNTLTLQAGTNITVQFDGSNNFQVKQTSGGPLTIAVTWVRIPI